MAKFVPVIQISNLFNNEKDNKREPTVGVGLHRMLTTNRKQPNRLKDRTRKMIVVYKQFVVIVRWIRK